MVSINSCILKHIQFPNLIRETSNYVNYITILHLQASESDCQFKILRQWSKYVKVKKYMFYVIEECVLAI